MFGKAMQIVLFLLPWSLRRRLLCLIYGFEVDQTASIGFSIVIARRLRLARNARIGHFSYISGLSDLIIEEEGRLGNFNWVTAVPKGNETFFSKQIQRNPQLLIGKHASITSRHLIDCTDTVSIGDFAVVAGWRSQILTHAVDLGESRQRADPVRIGKYCFVGTGVIILKGSVLPDYSVLGAGSVLTKKFERELFLYGGVPAREINQLSGEAAYFRRVV